MGTFVFIVFAVIAIAIFAAHSSEKAKRQAKEAYLGSLHQLKTDPANSDLRQRTLALGRVYSSLMRDKKGNTLFDEVALMNDINAACAATHQMISKPPQVTNSESIEDRLTKLQSLKHKGLINEDDFSRRKREIMDQI